MLNKTKTPLVVVLGLSFTFLGWGCGGDDTVTPDGGDARQEEKAEELGGTPSEPAPGQWDADPNAQ